MRNKHIALVVSLVAGLAAIFLISNKGSVADQTVVGQVSAPSTAVSATPEGGELTYEVQLRLYEEFAEKNGEACAILPTEGASSGHESGVFGKSLHVILPCTSYAYNALFFVVARDEAKQWHLVPFETYDAKAQKIGAVTYGLMNPTFHPLNDELNFFNKYRGIGDCGMSGTYQLDGGSLRGLLSELREKEACDGDASDWPVVYQK